ncbi:MAG: alpha-N-acetylglucosaminidase TIM-barrel domain-containing protein [Planctomycetota bacterium]|nr:alpha-N-acetylglucosaminidase TIM-barrel domain-containing protein [Planctomycetota bacterium]
MTIQISPNATWLEKHSAQELQKYIGLLSLGKAEIAPSDTLQKSQVVFLLGTVRTSAVIKDVCDRAGVDQAAVGGENDGFMIKAIRNDGQNVVVLCGNNQRSTLYAVYDYLENDCGVGFFADGEYIPALSQLPVDGIDRIRHSRFRFRWYVRWNRPVMKKYTARWHRWDELKRVADWEAKRKFNLRTSYASSIDIEGKGMDGIIEEVFNVPPQPEELCGVLDGWWYVNWFLPPKVILERKDKDLQYSRNLGFNMELWVPYGTVPLRYRQAHPEHIYVPGGNHVRNIDPKDPAATRFTKEVLKRTVQRFGTDHFYSMNAYGEQAPGKDPLNLKIDACLKTSQLLRELDPSPQMLWRTDAWDFMVNPGGIWTKQAVKKYLDAMPDFMYVADNTCDMLDEPLFVTHDYYHGKKWAFGLVLDLGGDDQLHGDIAEVLRRVRKATALPKGENCIGLHMAPENANFGIMFWHCLSQLAWNPQGWSEDKLIDDFCLHRYGEKSLPDMRQCWKILAEAMKLQAGGDFGNRPLYQVFLRHEYNLWKSQFAQRLEMAGKVAPLYEKAISLALKQWDNQKDNVLYENDLIDIIRSYVGKLSDFYFISAAGALEAKNRQDYEKYRQKMLAVMYLSAKLMSTRPDYSLSDTIRQIMKYPGANRHTEIGLKMSQYGQGYDTLDNYEQMVFAYIPMMEYVLDWLEGKYPDTRLAIGGPHASSNPVQRKWLLSPLDPPAEMKFSGTARQAVRYVIDEIGRTANSQEIGSIMQAAAADQAAKLGKLLDRKIVPVPPKNDGTLVREDFDKGKPLAHWKSSSVTLHEGVALVDKRLSSDVLQGRTDVKISYYARYYSQGASDWQTFKVVFADGAYLSVYCQGGNCIAQYKGKELKSYGAGGPGGEFRLYGLCVAGDQMELSVDGKSVAKIPMGQKTVIRTIEFYSNTPGNPFLIDWCNIEKMK